VSDAQVITVLVTIIGSLLVVIVTMVWAFVGWIVRRFDRFDAKFDRLDTRLEALTIAVSRLEGAVYHGLPEPRRAVEGQ